jgi:carbon-monoxide dehydrogenase medium subunit
MRDYEGDVRVLAGGMSLIPMMKLRLYRPTVLVDLARVSELSGIQESANGLTIGAMTTYHEIETSPLVRQHAPLLAETVHEVGDLQVRNRGTVGGAAAHADPAADTPAALLALEARFGVAGGLRPRLVRADRMFVEPYTTALHEKEIITSLFIPRIHDRTGSSYEKLPNRASRFAIVGVAAQVTLGEDGTCSVVRIGVTGASPVPWRARRTERYLIGRLPTDETLASSANRSTGSRDFLDDVHGSAQYREHLVRELTYRALRQSCEVAART